MSAHRAGVIEAKVEPHPNADQLGIVRLGAFEVGVRKDQVKDGDLLAYIEPDTLVPVSRPEFAFLAAGANAEGFFRVRPKRFRGRWSQGLLVAAPEGLWVGNNAWDALGLRRYEPPEENAGQGKATSIAGVPDFLLTQGKYDVENLRRYPDALDGHAVVISEKLHGANARYCFADGKLWVGTRTRWIDPEAPSWWSAALKRRPIVEEWCRANECRVLCGEVIGVQDLRYGVPSGEVDFRAFDVRDPAGYVLDPLPGLRDARVPTVPEVCRMGPFLLGDGVEALAEGQTLTGAGHLREGVVVRSLDEPVVETQDGVMRSVFKLVGNGYLERSR